MKKITVIMGSLALVAIMAVGAWAGPYGQGRGYGQGNCPGYAAGPGAGYGPGPQMSKEEFAKFQAKRAAFLKGTITLRQNAANKRIALRTEYAQVKPDEAKIKALRNELIDLRGQLAKKANDAGLPGMGLGRGFGPGKSRGFGPRGGGYGMGGGYGHGGYGPGNCWR